MSEQDTRKNGAAAPENNNTAASGDAPKKQTKKKARRRRRIGVPVTLTIVMLIISLLFGLVVGYAYGRNRNRSTINDLRDQVADLSNQLLIASGEAVDVFKDTPTPAEQAALNELSGESMADPQDNAASALGGDVFGEIDTAAQADDPVIVAEFKGGSITADTAQAEYARRMSEYLFSGFNEAADGSALMNSVLSDLVRNQVLYAQAEKLGLTDITDQDAEAVHAQAEAEYERRIEATTAFNAASGTGGADARAAAEKSLLENEGVTIDTIEADLKANLWKQKLYDAIVKDVTVTDTDVQALYDEMLAEQQKQFTDSADSYEFAQMSGETIAYNLSGYRRIQIIRLNVNNEDNVQTIYDLNDRLSNLDAEKDADEIARIQSELDALYATADARAMSVAEKLANGADFDDMIDQYGEDAGMKDASIRARGYAIAENSPLWAQDVRAAAMALAKVGDVSDPVRTGDGVCIVKYIGDVAEGAVPIDEIRSALTDLATENAKTAAYDAQISAWVSEADPAYYPERMQ